MRHKTIPQRLAALPREKKIIAIAQLVALVSCFLPWYGINSRVISQWWSAFGSIGSVAGYVIVTFAALSLLMILAPVVKPDANLARRLPWDESTALLFLSAQSCFITLLFIPVYSQYALLNATNSGARFGIYLALFSTLTASIVALMNYRQQERSSLRPTEFAQVPRQHREVNADNNRWGNEQPEDHYTPEEVQEALFEENPQVVEQAYSAAQEFDSDQSHSASSDDDFRSHSSYSA